MSRTYEERYYYIKTKINESRIENNHRKLKIWQNKLLEWEMDYGAYAPIK